jgi:thiol-disulfide isomerase/thioredoxin
MRAIMACVAALGLSSRAAIAQVAPILEIDVTDEAGQPVQGAQGYLLQDDLPLTSGWIESNKDGRLGIGMYDLVDEQPPEGKVVAVVRAPQHAWQMVPVDLPAERLVQIRLERGSVLELVLTNEDGRFIPKDLKPIVYVPGQSVAAWLSGVQRSPSVEIDSVFSTAVLQAGREGRFTLRVPEPCPPLYVIVNHPGFLRAFQAGPLEVKEGQVWVQLPSSGAIKVVLAPRQGIEPEYQACGAEVDVAPQIPEGGWSFRVAGQDRQAPRLEAHFDDLAPSGYSVRGFTGTLQQRFDRGRTDYFQEQTWIEVMPGHVETAKFDLETFNEAHLRASLVGDQSIKVKLIRSDGSPAAGCMYDISFSLPKFAQTISIAAGRAPEDGTILLENLPPAPRGVLQVQAGGAYMGQIIVRDTKEQVAEFTIPPVVGEAAPDVTLTEVGTNEQFALSSLRGQVVLLEFWASWCGPCQKPMAHNDRIMTERGEDWAGHAVIIGASIDQDIQVIGDHVDKRGWTNVLQTHCGNNAWQSGAASAYGVKSVPAAFLIDQEGMIVWAGHPGNLDVEAQIDALLDR